jgi:hypothetical protein
MQIDNMDPKTESHETTAQTQAATRWSAAHKVGFRFAFCYFALYLLFAAPSFLGSVTGQLRWHGTPIFEIPFLKIVPWVAAHILRYPVTDMGFSADSPYQYVKIFSFALVAVIATGVWSILDRQRATYTRLDQWLRVTLRTVLACTLFIYGGFKVIPTQMPAPSLTRMVQPYGDLTPFHALWNFMGSSHGYEILCGVVEVACGAFLLIPGMTMLGALLSLGAIGNVLVLNISYDVPVKIVPTHLCLFAFYLLLPYVPRIMNLFVFNRNIERERRSPLFQRRSLSYIAWGIQWALGSYFLVATLVASDSGAKVYRERVSANPLYGMWVVDEFAVDGQMRPPLLTDNLRWQRIVVDYEPRLPGTLTFAVEGMNGHWSPYFATLDEQKSSFRLRSPHSNDISEATEWRPSSWVDVNPCEGIANVSLNYSRPRPDALVVEGVVNGHQLRVTLEREDREFLLNTHKYRLVHETLFD